MAEKLDLTNMHILGDNNSIFNQFIAEIRDENIQKDRMRFRRNLERTGEIFAYEISKKLDFVPTDITTPLGAVNIPLIKEMPVLATILRAGLQMHQGLLNYFDNADNSFISAYRKHSKNDKEFTIKIEYISGSDLDNKTLILSDPMLATGASMLMVIKAIQQFGKPKHIHIVSLIASSEGISNIKKGLKQDNYTLWLGAVDDELTATSYIVPGLGDAGDLAYGPKQN
jgi:uracil phosphoribosyltransferase